MFDEHPFTFLIGPQEKAFFADGTLVSEASPVLNRLIRGPMKESHERIARLPEVEPDTFQTFLSHTYTSASVKTHAAKQLEEQFAYSKIIELLLRKGHESFKCRQCRESIELKFCASFPLCQSCQDKSPVSAHWSRKCVLTHCTKAADYVHGLLCKTCLGSIGFSVGQDYMSSASDLAKFRLAPLRSIQELESFHFDIPLYAKELARLTRESNRSMHLPCTDLIKTGRLALFADLYNVSDLFEATILGLYEQLAAFDCSEGRLTPVLELANMIYQHTFEIRTSNVQKLTVLRRLVLDYIVTHRSAFLNSGQAAALVEQEPEMLRDVILALATRLDEKDKN